ncbi:hypothetical protein TPHA_0A00830 [Tetrapisispora phaffii CBS 4417]|uniref:Uncharacterized protein n=1 Tax=Tetrapisispora phaffii (strain ATCC 24235 / CBS 4417 / NBRC 1672 / NRRL Y-8282 / UCD 70-5) TaxID=1071381 RepID=G8BMP0_TETPH|nr:hypothetical protein TPHA_0A00830 [Tetrapisispora phaffii CBS 4417]CCE61168.1 hypothetical protein TPHA_0A00830 [Tetrapisispora phaffii CBS 4417]
MLQLEEKLLKKLISRKASLEEIEAQEKQCVLSNFNNDVAFELGSFIRKAALELFPGKPVAIDISLTNGHKVFRTITASGSSLDNDFWITRKSKTVNRFNHSTFFMGCKKGDKTPEERFFVSSSEYAFHGGAVPLYLSNTDFPVAVLTVSGLKQEEDHLLAITSVVEFSKQTAEEELNLD